MTNRSEPPPAINLRTFIDLDAHRFDEAFFDAREPLIREYYCRVKQEPDELEPVFRDRGISREVRDRRPYIRWTMDDIRPVQEAYRDLPGDQEFMSRVARKADGWVMNRHAALDGDPHVFAEIRPDNPVETKNPTWHWHGDDHSKRPLGLGYKRVPKPPSGEERPAPTDLSPRHIHTAEDMEEHINREKWKDDHFGQNTDEIHSHANLAKYIFPPSPKREIYRSHDHTEQYLRAAPPKTYKTAQAIERFRHRRLAKLDEHIKKQHFDGDASGPHEHFRRKVKDWENCLARRLDMHPMAREKFKGARRVFFVIEGCLKADAVLSQGEAVFSVPAVTHWAAPEVERFIHHYLRGKQVIIVPDADWYHNGKVFEQAMLCRTFLRRHGIDAHVAAPPLDQDGNPIEHNGQKLKGVDDFLGAGYGLGDLHVIDRQPPCGLAEWVAANVGGRRDRMKRDTEFLQALALFADTDGRIRSSLRKVAKLMGVPPKKVSRALEDLREYGAVTIKGDLSCRVRGWVSRHYYSKEVDWDTTSVIILKSELRAKFLPPVRLADLEVPK
jgi:hypothetical protein